jgi:hypothetical protein
MANSDIVLRLQRHAPQCNLYLTKILDSPPSLTELNL